MADRLLHSLIWAGSKACKIAHICRAEKSLFSILVQEKGKLKNEKLDFKTLADVFIQQVAKSVITTQCPEINDRVYGEENNQFTNALGETITVEVKETEKETTNLLVKVLDGNAKAAKLFAATAHDHEDQLEAKASHIPQLSLCDFDMNEIGIWIDPIDSTSQYVREHEDVLASEYDKVFPVGLQCVTVLIGAYNIVTGLPVMGVLFQPFHTKKTSTWQSKLYWGFCHDDLRMNNIDTIHQENLRLRSDDELPVSVVSLADDVLHGALKRESSVSVCTASGAGYKCLCVVNGLVDTYMCSSDTCYTWDTCAVHALLLSLGGGIIPFKHASTDVTGSVDLSKQLHYNKPNEQGSHPWVHVGGLVAYSNSNKSLRCLNTVKKLDISL